MSGRSGARPIPPATIDDVAPVGLLDRPAATERAAQAERSPRLEPVSAAVAGPAARMVRSRPSGRKREMEIGAAEKAGSAAITNWPGRPARMPGRRRPRWSVTVSAVSGRASGPGRREPRPEPCRRAAARPQRRRAGAAASRPGERPGRRVVPEPAASRTGPGGRR